MVFQFTSWHLTLGGIERSIQGHLVFFGLCIILNVLLDSGAVGPRGLLFIIEWIGLVLWEYAAVLLLLTVQITFIFIDFRVCDFAFAFKTQNAPCVSRFKRVLFSDRFQFAF